MKLKIIIIIQKNVPIGTRLSVSAVDRTMLLVLLPDRHVQRVQTWQSAWEQPGTESAIATLAVADNEDKDLSCYTKRQPQAAGGRTRDSGHRDSGMEGGRCSGIGGGMPGDLPGERGGRGD